MCICIIYEVHYLACQEIPKYICMYCDVDEVEKQWVRELATEKKNIMK